MKHSIPCPTPQGDVTDRVEDLLISLFNVPPAAIKFKD
jgi:hypothetical protein